MGESGFETGFESMIVSMGLASLPVLQIIDTADEEEDREKVKKGLNEDVKGLTTLRSRESVMSDVLSWVESSSSIV